MVSQSESQSPVPSADAPEAAMRAASVTPRPRGKSRKPAVKGAVTSSVAHNTRYATRLRSGAQVPDTAADAEHLDNPATPITMIRIAPGTSLVNEVSRQQGLFSSPAADEPPRKEALHCGIIVLSEPLLLLEGGVPAIIAPALPANQPTDVAARLAQTPLAAGSSFPSTGESIVITILFIGVLNGSICFRRTRTTGTCSAP